MSKIIKLTVHNTKVASKDEGKGIVDGYYVSEFNLDKAEDLEKLKFIFKNVNHSVNVWSNGHSRGDGYNGVTGVALDFDNGVLTIDGARKKFKDYIYLLYTSTYHKRVKPTHEDEGEPERFRIILPFNLNGEYKFSGDRSGDKFYTQLKETYPDADPSVFEKGRKFYPMVGPSENYLFEYNLDGKWYDFELKNTSVTNKKVTRKPSKLEFLDLDQEIKLPNGKVIFAGDTNVTYNFSNPKKSKTQACYCINPECPDEQSKSPSGFIGINGHGERYFYCVSCKTKLWEKNPRYNPEKADFHFHGSAGGVLLHQEGVPMSYVRDEGSANWRNFCNENKVNPRCMSFMQRVEVVVDPTRKDGYDDKDRVYNLFKTPGLLKLKYEKVTWKDFISVCPVTYDVLKNTLRDDKTIQKFLEWVSYILVTRKKALTAWIISSDMKGTGKNRIIENILGPFFGERRKQWVVTPGKSLGAEFNKSDITLWLQAYNEVWKKGSLEANLKIGDELKSMITDEDRVAHFKYMDAFYVDNITNFIFMSNHRTAILLEDMDRRYNVVHMRKEETIKLMDMPWWKGYKDFCKRIEDERKLFAGYVLNIGADEDSVNTPIESYDKEILISSSLDGFESVLKILENKDVTGIELDKIFPRSSSGYAIKENETKFDECAESISKYGGIPSKYVEDIFGFHWRKTGYQTLVNKLKSYGYKSQNKSVCGIQTRVYMK